MHTWRYARSSIRVFRGERRIHRVVLSLSSPFEHHALQRTLVRETTFVPTVTAPPLSADQSWDNEIIIIIVRYAH